MLSSNLQVSMVTNDKIMMSSVLHILKNLVFKFSLSNPSNYANLQSSGKHRAAPTSLKIKEVWFFVDKATHWTKLGNVYNINWDYFINALRPFQYRKLK